MSTCRRAALSFLIPRRHAGNRRWLNRQYRIDVVAVAASAARRVPTDAPGQIVILRCGAVAGKIVTNGLLSRGGASRNEIADAVADCQYSRMNALGNEHRDFRRAQSLTSRFIGFTLRPERRDLDPVAGLQSQFLCHTGIDPQRIIVHDFRQKKFSRRCDEKRIRQTLKM